MGRVVQWLAFGIAGVVLASPAFADWAGRSTSDGHGHSFFLMHARSDTTRAEIFCGPSGTVNFSLIWPDRSHPDAADKGEPVDMSIRTDGGQDFAAPSYYWASGKGQLILDFGNPGEVRAIVEALKSPDAGLTVTVDDKANDISKTAHFAPEGAADAAYAFLAWCPAAR